MKPQRGSGIAGPSLGGLWGRSATGDNGQAAKERSCRYGDGAECRKNISGVPTGEVFFHLTSFIGPKLRKSLKDGKRHPPFWQRQKRRRRRLCFAACGPGVSFASTLFP